jgi:hypothetical protein
MSGDGTVLVFLSHAKLTADDIASSCANPGENGTHLCNELYRYDDRDGSLECVSCVHGGVTTQDAFNEGGLLAFRVSRDGGTVAFTTAEPLVGSDVNGGMDVYEWRNGAVGLVTDGETEFAGDLASPTVLGVDADGSNIFFRVADPGLTGFEQDGVDNAYDARVGGGFAVPTPAVPCSEESCQGPLQGAPALQQPGSAGLAGAGNAKPKRRPCARKHGRAHRRCIRKHKKHLRHMRKTSAAPRERAK